MPHGYECDRCGTFVEENHPAIRPTDGGPGGRPVEQVVVHPPTDSDNEFNLNEYTLCETCRGKLVKWVEGIGPRELCGVGVPSTTNPLSTSNSPFEWTFDTDDYERIEIEGTKFKGDSSLLSVSGVGVTKAKRLHDAGFDTVDDLREASQMELADVEGIGNALAARIKADVGGLEDD